MNVGEGQRRRSASRRKRESHGIQRHASSSSSLLVHGLRAGPAAAGAGGNHSGVSPGSWIPTLWMLAISSKPISQWFGVSGDNESGSLLDQVFADGPGSRRHCRAGAPPIRLARGVAPQRMASGPVGLHVRQHAVVRHQLDRAEALGPRGDCRDHGPGARCPKRIRARPWRASCADTAYILVPFSLLLIKYYPALGVAYASGPGCECGSESPSTRTL